MAKKSDAKAGEGKPKRGAQIKAVFAITRQRDKRLVPVMLAWFFGVFAVLFGIGWGIGSPIVYGVVGVLAGMAAATVIFSRRAQRAAYREMEGQPGAAAAIVQGMRGDWRLTPTVAFNRQQDVVHRVIGRPGVILLGEGNPQRVAQLINQEKRRVLRVVTEVPIYDFQVGVHEGQVPVGKLQNKLTRLPRNLKGGMVNAVEGRMRALGGPSMPIPKGPLPRGARLPKGPRPPR